MTDIQPVHAGNRETRSKFAGGVAVWGLALLLVVLGTLLLAFGQLPAILLLVAAAGLAVWGSRRLKQTTESGPLAPSERG